LLHWSPNSPSSGFALAQGKQKRLVPKEDEALLRGTTSIRSRNTKVYENALFDWPTPAHAVTGNPVTFYSADLSSSTNPGDFSAVSLRMLPACASFSIRLTNAYSSWMLGLYACKEGESRKKYADPLPPSPVPMNLFTASLIKDALIRCR
jgi:hypothetical protein